MRVQMNNEWQDWQIVSPMNQSFVPFNCKIESFKVDTLGQGYKKMIGYQIYKSMVRVPSFH